MSALQNQPTNLSYLSPLSFRLVLDRTPKVNYFLTGAEVPAVTLGDKLRYDPLTINFNVDEDIRNYEELYSWLQGLGFPEDFQQYRNLRDDPNRTTSFGQDANIYSDGSLILMTAAQNPNLNIKFKNMFPISLSAITLNTTDGDVNYVQATASFRYSTYSIELI